jgi:hypothetical protein
MLSNSPPPPLRLTSIRFLTNTCIFQVSKLHRNMVPKVLGKYLKLSAKSTHSLKFYEKISQIRHNQCTIPAI